MDATNFGGTVDFKQISASGASTISLGGGDFSAGGTDVNGAFTLDASTSTSGTVTLTDFSAGGNSVISMGGGSGSISLVSAYAGGSLTVNATNFSGTASVQYNCIWYLNFQHRGRDTGAFSAGLVSTDGNNKCSLGLVRVYDLVLFRQAVWYR